ncbi:hypothetical protein NQ317_006953 [Molorchus minor]|uniref:Uncharacterized protein n=1 Tax=Molorchus minor TaxID=1323400 RepID=A0ABQ9J1P2_9CUCU|nr:hypothetical protein NQ317_006953 [Molorchus minor]
MRETLKWKAQRQEIKTEGMLISAKKYDIHCLSLKKHFRIDPSTASALVNQYETSNFYESHKS